MTKHSKILKLQIPLLDKVGLRVGTTFFLGRVKNTRGFNNTCRYCKSNEQVIFWDFRPIGLIGVIDALKRIRDDYPFVNPISIFGNDPDNYSYRAICPMKIDIELNKDIVMQTKYIDRAFAQVYIAGSNSRRTIRLASKGQFKNKHIMTLDNGSRGFAEVYSYPHSLWLNHCFGSPVVFPNDQHNLDGLTMVDYETTSW